MTRLADLHVHSTASDGVISPAAVVEAARDAGLAAVAITDHDTVAGVEEALDAGKRLGVEVIAGVEISTLYGAKTEVHILGYLLDLRSRRLLDALGHLENARFDRARRMVERLNDAGIPVTFERVQQLAQGGAIGRPHVARALVEMKVASSMDSAFGKFLQEGGVGYVERHKVTPAEAVDIILQAGGVPGVAHVAKLGRDDLVIELIDRGLRAIEVYHPDHSSAKSRFYRKFARFHGLIATGGSDAHFIDPLRYPGIGARSVDYAVVEQLREAAAAVRSNDQVRHPDPQG